MMMKRRDALKTAGLILGYSLTMGTTAAVLGGCSADDTSSDWSPTTLNKDQIRTLEKLADAMVPGTDELPGAKDVNIGKFMDERLTQYAEKEEQDKFMSNYEAFIQKNDVAKMSDDELMAMIRSELDSGSDFMRTVYEQSVVGLCTSERGMKEILVFKPIPGEQRGCVPFEEVGGIWAI